MTDDDARPAPIDAQTITRERRRAEALRDAEILARDGPDPDLMALAEYVVTLDPVSD